MSGILGFTGLLILLFWQWLYHTAHDSYHLDQNTLEQTANVIIYGLQYRQYNAKGELLHFLEAPKMSHIPKNNIHVLNQPHLIVTEPDKDPWEMHADLGTAINKSDKIVLEHHVVLNQHHKTEDMLLNTEYLTYFPAEKKAITTNEVLITQGKSRIQSTGLVANLADNQIHLQNARGHHVPTVG